ncbi:DMT family transporter [Corynebacterium diphtheriae]|uniref:DMT family transporter n=1 Tax=Corynebacterium diphtheriae TaxID=1717 RepID=UPI000390369E|nr:DMT family transporter [Corynebacterium diphtheriae]ERA51945.1 putative integral membrane protein [Corynebacterium diphtheriae str. Aberdeen]KLN38221.1 membrane protein [Corynebacterium diphtheriae bv. gravis str. ISS 4746]KLN43600.1 membrane protein [Corynebacterium diphtheriae bv. gravis str. ISS 4749]MBG9271310.1 DMT family transporter [Corynebacterium diphtheriae bv. gravis]MBG9370354.1 DMT family transporter [Corynebacterium diphtheriae bv. gravis]
MYFRIMKTQASLLAILAAALYALNVPVAKMLLDHTTATMLAAFLYLGAGIGMIAFARPTPDDAPITAQDTKYVVAMVVLDIAAPILLMLGIARTTSSSVSLLGNFEIVATSLIALILFREVISKHLWLAIGLVTLASLILSFEPGTIQFNLGSLLVLAACACWGLENNCTRALSNKNPAQIVVIKGIFSGLGALTVALLLANSLPSWQIIALTMALGFVSYGLSITFYIMAQRHLGAAKTSAYYAIAPFLGVAFSMVLLGERPDIQFWLALAIMGAATVVIVRDSIGLQHDHMHTHVHTHQHSHGDLVHTHAHTHTHSHLHAHEGDSEEPGHSVDHHADFDGHEHD